MLDKVKSKLRELELVAQSLTGIKKVEFSKPSAAAIIALSGGSPPPRNVQFSIFIQAPL
jgi:hypothetical protein